MSCSTFSNFFLSSSSLRGLLFYTLLPRVVFLCHSSIPSGSSLLLSPTCHLHYLVQSLTTLRRSVGTKCICRGSRWLCEASRVHHQHPTDASSRERERVQQIVTIRMNNLLHARNIYSTEYIFGHSFLPSIFPFAFDRRSPFKIRSETLRV